MILSSVTLCLTKWLFMYTIFQIGRDSRSLSYCTSLVYNTLSVNLVLRYVKGRPGVALTENKSYEFQMM